MIYALLQMDWPAAVVCVALVAGIVAIYAMSLAKVDARRAEREAIVRQLEIADRKANRQIEHDC